VTDIKSRILPLEAFAGQQYDAARFLEQYTHPFLVLETKEGDFGSAGFQTLATGGKDLEERDPKDSKSTLHDDEESSRSTDLDLARGRAPKPVDDKAEEMKKKLDEAHLATYVCPLVKRDVNKFASMITLGRAANNDIRLNLPSISKFHAYFTHVQSNDTWFLADANSSNGTFVNGEKLKGDHNRIKLENGAGIRLGSDVTMHFFTAKSFFEFLQTRLGTGGVKK
jgi:hypothetical protein